MYEIRRFFDPPVPVGSDLSIIGIGVMETMTAGSFIDRPGREDCLCMFFHDPSRAGVGDSLKPAQKKLIIWSPFTHQSYGNLKSKWRHSWVHLVGKRLPRQLKTLGIETECLLEYPQLEQAFLTCLRTLFEECCETNPLPDILSHTLDIFMIRLARGCHSSGLIIPSYVRRAKTLLDTNYRHPWTLNELARTTGSSVSHLSAAFTQHLGSPPMSYLRQLRLNQAALLLRNRGLRVGEVAQEVGYRDIFHFSKAFKQAYGQSPSFYIKSA